MSELRRRSVRGFVIAAAYVLLACEDESPTRSADGGMDSGRDGSVMDTTTRWIATRTTLDTWWQATLSVDAGRGNIEIYALTRITGACGQAGDEATIKICGLALPPLTSDPSCDAFQLTVPNHAWDSPNMPRFVASSMDELDAGDGAITAIVHIGIALDEGATWPTPMTTHTFTCEDGTGAACFPDHDNDTFPGLTTHYRNDGAIYIGPYDTGRCTNGVAYRYRSGRTSIDTYGGIGTRVDGVHLGIGAALSLNAARTACDSAEIDSASARINLRSIGCVVDPTTLLPDDVFFPGDPRLTSMDYTCRPDEARGLDEHFLPTYRVLRAGDRPGDSMRKLGWERAGRDIDKRVSEGTRTESITLNVDDIDAGGDGEPSCAQVRAVFGND